MLYDKIKALCDEKAISIRALENELGFSNGSIVKWKDSVPSADKLKKVADYFGLPIEYFLEEPRETG